MALVLLVKLIISGGGRGAGNKKNNRGWAEGNGYN